MINKCFVLIKDISKLISGKYVLNKTT